MDCRQIQFCALKDRLDLSQLQELFNLTAFWAQGRSLEDLSVAISNSDPVISVWDETQLIGFGRATSDGIYRANIWDVVIHPDYRQLGLGTKLVESILSHPRLSRVEKVYLMTTHQQHFYQKIGFSPNETTTMVIENRSNLNQKLLLVQANTVS
jgi:N-acetylglutamate synthase-like GNAT family acetyltransferase